MQEAASKPNVTILQSNGFEGHYALHWRGVDWSSAPLLYPAGLGGRPSLLRALGRGVGRGAGDPTQEGGRGEGEAEGVDSSDDGWAKGVLGGAGVTL